MHHRYGVRFAEREIEARQREVAQRAEQLRPAAYPGSVLSRTRRAGER